MARADWREWVSGKGRIGLEFAQALEGALEPGKEAAKEQARGKPSQAQGVGAA